MKKKLTILAALFLLLALPGLAQDFEVPSKQPSTKEEFIQSEKEFISAANWLEKTPLGTAMDKRKLMNAWLLVWITNSPTVTVEVRASLLKPFDKNPDLMIVFMGGYARYCIENNYSNDQLKCNVAGMKSVLNCYNLGGDIKKDKNLSKVADADKDGKLEQWVADAMKEK